MTKDLTVIITNYRRPDNVRALAETIRHHQTLDVDLVIVDNGPTPFHHPATVFDRVIRDPTNSAACALRWHAAAWSETPFALVIDDDLRPIDRRVLSDTLEALERYYPRPVAAAGVLLKPGKDYAHCRHIGYGRRRRFAEPIAADTLAHILKGRYFAAPVERLRTLPAWLPRFEDDIAASAYLGGGLVLEGLQNRFDELDPGDAAVSARPDHMQQREAARRLYFHDDGEPRPRPAVLPDQAATLRLAKKP